MTESQGYLEPKGETRRQVFNVRLSNGAGAQFAYAGETRAIADAIDTLRAEVQALKSERLSPDIQGNEPYVVSKDQCADDAFAMDVRDDKFSHAQPPAEVSAKRQDSQPDSESIRVAAARLLRAMDNEDVGFVKERDMLALALYGDINATPEMHDELEPQQPSASAGDSYVSDEGFEWLAYKLATAEKERDEWKDRADALFKDNNRLRDGLEVANKDLADAREALTAKAEAKPVREMGGE